MDLISSLIVALISALTSADMLCGASDSSEYDMGDFLIPHRSKSAWPIKCFEMESICQIIKLKNMTDILTDMRYWKWCCQC